MKPRIEPIDKPKSITGKLIFFFLKREFGRVITPAKVIYARYPNIGLLVKKIYDVEKDFRYINEGEQFLIQNLVATLNGCTFCMDISKRKTVDKKIGLDKFYDLMRYSDSKRYTEREKAIFQFVEEMTKSITVSDKTYESLKGHCTDEEIIEIVYTASSENFLNRLIKPLNIGSDELCGIK
jgi:hypothetical protein